MGLLVTCPIFLSLFQQFGVCRQIIIKVPIVIFHGNPTSGNRDDSWRTDGQTEGRATLSNLTGVLRNYVQLDNKHWYDHVPKSVETIHEGGVTILWNLQVRNDRTIPNNKPNIIICDNKHGTCMLTHYSGRVMQICVFNTVKLGTSASSP